MLGRTWWVACALCMLGCSADGDGRGSRDGAVTAGAGTGAASCTPGEEESCTCASGRSGSRTCDDGVRGTCVCPGDVGSAAGTSATAGTGGAGTSAGTGAGTGVTPRPDCDPGTYVGTYNCMLEVNGTPSPFPLTGPVQFALEIDETTVAKCDPGDEFCSDLVIAEGSGTLFGFATFVGFETQLEGGLDCKTGEFRASGPDGIWGPPVAKNPNDPMSELTIAQPPSGTFSGTLAGQHVGGSPQKIEGEWDLLETAFGYRCKGPFTVERMP